MSVIAAKKISVKEFSEMDLDENFYYELINGNIVKKQAPKPLHQRASMRLSKLLSNFVDEKQIGEMFASPIDVFFDDYNNTQPDLLFIKKERSFIVTNNDVEGAPDLIIEILSPSTQRTDKREKYKLYQEFGVQEYWIVDPNNKSIDVFSLENNRYENLFVATDNETIQSQVLEGFSLEVSQIFI